MLQGGHDLLEELGRQTIALGQGSQGDRPLILVADEVDEGSQAVFRAAGEAHGRIVPNDDRFDRR